MEKNGERTLFTVGCQLIWNKSLKNYDIAKTRVTTDPVKLINSC